MMRSRRSNDEHHVDQQIFREETPSSYAQGFSAGFEAGRRASLAEGTHSPGRMTTNPIGQHIHGPNPTHPPNTRSNGINRENRPKTFPHPSNRESLDRSTPSPRRLSGGFQTRQIPNRPEDNSPVSPANHHEHEHEMNGQISTPETAVKYNPRGHY